MKPRTVIGWRERERLAEQKRHSQQFSQVRMPGKLAAQLHKGNHATTSTQKPKR